METLKPGGNGSGLPMVLGTMYFGTRVAEGAAHRLLDAAADAGAVFWDTANNYAFWAGGTGDESEAALGRWFAARPRGRDRIALASKVGARPRPGTAGLDHALGLSAPSVREQVEASLRRLRTDRLDVLYAHIDDTAVPLAETVGALQEEVRRGTAVRIGCSNITRPRLAEALAAAGSGPRYGVLQQRFTYLTPVPGADLAPHVLLDDGLADFAAAEGVALTGYSTLLGGAYTRADRPVDGAYRHGRTAAQLAALDRASAATGLDAGQVVLAWMVQRERPVLPVVGASTAGQLASAAEAVRTPLPAGVAAALDAARTAAP